MIARARREPWGAWVGLADGTLVAVDSRRAESLAVRGVRWIGRPAPRSAPLEVHVAVTAHCPVSCAGCYQDASQDGTHVPLETLVTRLESLARAGVFTVAFGGGEPLLHPRIGEIARAARALGLVPVVTTSGLGLERRSHDDLCAFAQVNVSHDGVGGAYRAVRGFDGAPLADRALTRLRELGIAAGVNLVLTRASLPVLLETADHVRALGARELQLLRYKPAGRARSPEYLATRPTPQQFEGLADTLALLATRHAPALSTRIDCALVPFLAGRVPVRELQQWGVFGCEAGRRLATVDVHGTVHGCSFQGSDPEPSDADAASYAFDASWSDGADPARFRTRADEPAPPCRTCEAHPVCRGGCAIVASHVTGRFDDPDPECPRVRAWHGSRVPGGEDAP